MLLADSRMPHVHATKSSCPIADLTKPLVQEVEAKTGLQEHLSRILAPKRILLWEEMLKEANYPDMGVVNELLHGTELV